MLTKELVSKIRQDLKIKFPTFKFKVSKYKDYYLIVIISEGPLNLENLLLGKLTLTRYFINQIEDLNIKNTLSQIYDLIDHYKKELQFTESIRIGEYNKKYIQLELNYRNTKT